MKGFEYYTAPQVAKMLGVTNMSVNRWIRAGKLKAYKFGRVYRIPVEEFERFVRESKVG